MKLGRVIGTVWAVRKAASLTGCRMLVVQPLSSAGVRTGTPIVAADPRSIAGIGDRVVVVTSTDAAQAFDTAFAPVNASVVALVDAVA
jgi:ethanolamine utilization protein EutN